MPKIVHLCFFFWKHIKHLQAMFMIMGPKAPSYLLGIQDGQTTPPLSNSILMEEHTIPSAARLPLALSRETVVDQLFYGVLVEFQHLRPFRLKLGSWYCLPHCSGNELLESSIRIGLLRANELCFICHVVLEHILPIH